ncbi:uncharacterized protein LOC127874047 [Dreissena polymorpha]|uniref:Uncharacterized protein n=1 Tax=Dreissena polymorpha TaxID=45954 RepID=A0A9D4L1L3_DREPO|nr:uncharacterized protein LOC127874047 [Dreissena polymorpha]KAH3848786.1 hypothetical protein DPMN_091166 [Dreissena polymorpha]
METITTPPLSVTGLEPDLECYFRGSLFAHHHVILHVTPSEHVSREMRALSIQQSVRQIRKFIISILYLVLITSPVSAFPSQKMDKPKTIIIQDLNNITVRTTGCKPLTLEQKKTLMGSAFDDSMMRIDDVADSDIIQNDAAKSANSVIKRKNEGRDSNEEFLENLQDESQIDGIDGSKKGSGDTISVQKFMRRKRTVIYISDIEDSDVNEDKDEVELENTNTLSDTRFLYQNMLFETTSKRRTRERRAASGNDAFHPAWECEKKSGWKTMQEGIFPKKVWDSVCTQKSCFFGLYRCKPVKYTIHLLKRDSADACNPLPMVGDSTAYEEKWEMMEYSATVACECGLKGSKGSSGGKNRKDRQRKKGRNE